jgi:enediyne polyketide synthase
MYVRHEENIGTETPVAIVGAALRFPGASDPASFHELAIAGRRMFRELAQTALCRGQADGRGLAVLLDGGSLHAALLDSEGTVQNEDAGVTASGVTGRHTLAAETAAAALEDVPPGGRKLGAGSGRIGVIIADTPEPGARDVSDWVRDRLGLAGTVTDRTVADGSGMTGAAATARGNGTASSNGHADSNGTAGPDEVAGPSRTDGSDGAGSRQLYCSLRAIAAACEALNAGEFDLVLAGGVSRGIDSGWLSRHAEAGALATGDMRVYDVSPTGTLPGEGCGVVALMRAADARIAGLPVYADIAGWHAADADAAEQAAVRPAYLRAGVDPADIQFVEGHGAATAAEDLAELSALLEVLGPREDGTRGRRCALGAVSANIGDTRGAAGIAALLKTALAMTADTIPPTTGCIQPHELLQGENAPFRLPSAPEPWPETAVKLAAVNSLGGAARPGAPRSGAVHIVLRREREPGGHAGRRRRAAHAPHGAAANRHAPNAAATAPRRAAGAHVAPPQPRTPKDSYSPVPRSRRQIQQQPGAEATPEPGQLIAALAGDQPAGAAVPVSRSPGGLLRRLADRLRRAAGRRPDDSGIGLP